MSNGAVETRWRLSPEVGETAAELPRNRRVRRYYGVITTLTQLSCFLAKIS